MSRLISKIICLATIAAVFIFVFISLIRPTEQNLDAWDSQGAVSDMLRGAIPQKSAVAPAATIAVSKINGEVNLVSDPRWNEQGKLDEEEMKKKEEDRKNMEQLKEKKENEAKKKAKDDAYTRAQEEYKKFKVYPGTFDVPKDIYYEPSGPKPHEILILTASDGKGHNGGIPNIMSDITPNRQEYADLHGYIYQFLNITMFNYGKAHPVWAKLPAIVEAFNRYPQVQWIWWLDLDALIMTPTVDLREYILSPEALEKKLLKGAQYNRSGGGNSGYFTTANPVYEDIDIIIAQDHNGVNAGSFFIRRSLFTKYFIDIWSDSFFVREKGMGQEQDALFHLIKEHPTFNERVGLVELKEINAYALINVKGWSWEKGLLAVHFAGCWVEHKCAAKWNEYKGYLTPASAIKHTYKQPKHPSEIAPE